ncbi:hypothetical protein BDQ17DRAFT_1362933 [Cyathus striatus]|nr:hypothetical protein BDQ17DRAFT_1362933 [Cyathus striatus]
MSLLLRSLSLPLSPVRVITPLQVRVLSRSTPSAAQSQSQSHALERIKHPTRGGRNIGERYRTLEKSLRGKQARSQDIATLEHTTADAAHTPSTAAKYDINTFHGFKIPEEPKPPADDECCMSGCAVCVYDLYEESLQAYKDSLEALRSSLVKLNIPEGEWPASIQLSSPSNTSQGTPQQRQEAVMSAFEKMELALKAKHVQAQGPQVVEDKKDGVEGRKSTLS